MSSGVQYSNNELTLMLIVERIFLFLSEKKVRGQVALLHGFFPERFV